MYNINAAPYSSKPPRVLGGCPGAGQTPQLVSCNMRAPQLVSCRERRTGISVILVGAMHHNSHSIRLAERAVADAAASGSLRAVLVESCPTRWNTTLASRGSWLARHCPDEMYAAAVAAAKRTFILNFDTV